MQSETLKYETVDFLLSGSCSYILSEAHLRICANENSTTVICFRTGKILNTETEKVFVFYGFFCFFIVLSEADKECPHWKEVCSLSMQLPADLQSHITEDRLPKTILVRAYFSPITALAHYHTICVDEIIHL